MADYAVVYVERKNVNEAQYKLVLPQAKETLAKAKEDEILMLQIQVNSPKTLVKAFPLSEENLAKIAKID